MLGGHVKSVLGDVVDAGNGVGVKERLTRDRICEVALEAIDEAGLESLSMRMLASALGIKASSLYYHFENKDELLTGVAEFLYRKLGRPPSRGDWTEQVKGTFIQLRDFIETHPNAAPLLVRDLAYSPVAKKRANVLLKMVSRVGLDPNTSASLISNLVALLVGHTYLTLWVREEAGSATKAESGDGGDGMGVDADLDGSRVWVHKLFPAKAPRSAGYTAAAAGDGRSDQTPPNAATAALPAGRRTKSGATASSDPAGELSDDGGFLAGLDALIRGFAPD